MPLDPSPILSSGQPLTSSGPINKTAMEEGAHLMTPVKHLLKHIDCLFPTPEHQENIQKVLIIFGIVTSPLAKQT